MPLTPTHPRRAVHAGVPPRVPSGRLVLAQEPRSGKREDRFCCAARTFRAPLLGGTRRKQRRRAHLDGDPSAASAWGTVPGPPAVGEGPRRCHDGPNRSEVRCCAPLVGARRGDCGSHPRPWAFGRLVLRDRYHDPTRSGPAVALNRHRRREIRPLRPPNRRRGGAETKAPWPVEGSWAFRFARDVNGRRGWLRHGLPAGRLDLGQVALPRTAACAGLPEPIYTECRRPPARHVFWAGEVKFGQFLFFPFWSSACPTLNACGVLLKSRYELIAALALHVLWNSLGRPHISAAGPTRATRVALWKPVTLSGDHISVAHISPVGQC